MFKLHVTMACAVLMQFSYLTPAGPVTHAYVAFIWLKRCMPHYTAKQKKLFILGTLFPDIRYIAGITRSATHLKEMSLEKVSQESEPFLAGKKFHAWVDDKRNEFIKPHLKNIYSLVLADVPKTMVSTYIKFLEDELLFALRPWQDVCTYLKTVVGQEKESNIALQTLKRWHSLLHTHFTRQPSTIFARLASKNQSYGTVSPELVKTWAHTLPKHVHLSGTIRYVYTLLADFEEAFAQFYQNGRG